MRNNQPVTQHEYELPDHVTLMSSTDVSSHITYANAAFVAASGFEMAELLGQPHNMVRHPDMPREAFADLWATMKGGSSWSALVKNRRRNGDHYWVRANAAPVWRGGQVSGYLSVRTKPTRQEVAAAEALYRRFREGRAGSRRLGAGRAHQGQARIRHISEELQCHVPLVGTLRPDAVPRDATLDGAGQPLPGRGIRPQREEQPA